MTKKIVGTIRRWKASYFPHKSLFKVLPDEYQGMHCLDYDFFVAATYKNTLVVDNMPCALLSRLKSDSEPVTKEEVREYVDGLVFRTTEQLLKEKEQKK